jgi:hypothetical protein
MDVVEVALAFLAGAVAHGVNRTPFTAGTLANRERHGSSVFLT